MSICENLGNNIDQNTSSPDFIEESNKELTDLILSGLKLKWDRESNLISRIGSNESVLEFGSAKSINASSSRFESNPATYSIFLKVTEFNGGINNLSISVRRDGEPEITLNDAPIYIPDTTADYSVIENDFKDLVKKRDAIKQEAHDACIDEQEKIALGKISELNLGQEYPVYKGKSISEIIYLQENGFYSMRYFDLNQDEISDVWGKYSFKLTKSWLLEKYPDFVPFPK